MTENFGSYTDILSGRMETLPPDASDDLTSVALRSPGLQNSPLESTRIAMHRVLRNRKGQLLMLIFRPYMAVLAKQHPTDGDFTMPVSVTLLGGAKRYVYHAINFLEQQPEHLERHYGVWLLARNIWSCALSLITVLHMDVLIEFLISQEVDPTSRAAALEGLQGTILSAVASAAKLLQQWGRESPSLAFCAEQIDCLLLNEKCQRNMTEPMDE